MTTTINCLDNEHVTVPTVYLQNSFNYTEFRKIDPDRQWYLPFCQQVINSLYQDVYPLLIEHEPLPNSNYIYWHRLFVLAEYLVDDLALVACKQQIMIILDEAYPNLVSVQIHTKTGLDWSFRCRNRPVVILRKIIDQIRRKELLQEYLVLMVLLADPVYAQRFVPDPQPQLVAQLANPQADLLEIYYCLYDNMLQRCRQVCGLSTPPLEGFNRLLSEIDFNTFKPHPLSLTESAQGFGQTSYGSLLDNGIFHNWDKNISLSAYLYEIEQRIINYPEEYWNLWQLTSTPRQGLYITVVDGKQEYAYINRSSKLLLRRPSSTMRPPTGPMGLGPPFGLTPNEYGMVRCPNTLSQPKMRILAK